MAASPRRAFFRPLFPAIQIYGANTGVGKTVVSTLLGKSFKRLNPTKQVAYLKPVSTGPKNDNDAKYVNRFAHIDTHTLYQFRDPVSPHIAARATGYTPPRDSQVVRGVLKYLNEAAKGEGGLLMVETAGGVLSPGPSGTPQADLFRTLRLPVVLVGDHRLGGIATTMSAVESLTLRGYDIVAVVIPKGDLNGDIGGDLGNYDYLKKRLGSDSIQVFSIPQIPNLDLSSSESEDVWKSRFATLNEYYKTVSHSHAPSIITCIKREHARRVADLDRLSSNAVESIWHPFTQHKDPKSAKLLAIDSAYDDFFQLYNPPAINHLENDGPQPISSSSNNPVGDSSQSDLQPAFDGSASWWTQGLGHGNHELALAAAYAAGRYGHVMFAGAVHEPALRLAQNLITLMGGDKSRLRKVFYTDDGSTGVEVGIKMALKASSVRYGWDGSSTDVGIIGLKGSYHGDTIGAMDCSEPSVYNKKVEWYRGRGYWFDYPQVKLKKGKWTVEAPAGMEDDFGPPQQFDSIREVFGLANRNSTIYEQYISKILKRLVQDEGKKFGALVMEPVLLGAGGMILVDPLFQQTLARVVRTSPILASMSENPVADINETAKNTLDWTGLPVVFDEVFTGMYRLGRFSSSSFLDTQPDISVHAKLLTGGLLPLCATMASQSIFDAFLSDDKSDALLHGHSYTAHAIGCHVANVSIEKYAQLQKSNLWTGSQFDWTPGNQNPEGSNTVYVRTIGLRGDSQGQKIYRSEGVWSMWAQSFVNQLSHREEVEGVIAIGSVLAITLVDESGTGYTSNAAIELRDNLMLPEHEDRWSIHSRVLGNIFYLMASMNSHPNTLSGTEKMVIRELDKIASKKAGKDSNQGLEPTVPSEP